MRDFLEFKYFPEILPVLYNFGENIKLINSFVYDLDLSNYANHEISNNSNLKVMYFITNLQAFNGEAVTRNLLVHKDINGTIRNILLVGIPVGASVPLSAIKKDYFLASRVNWNAAPIVNSTSISAIGYRIELI